MRSPEIASSTKVLIVGKGISGLVLSHLLDKAGIEHLLLSRKENRKRFVLGETLPPSTVELLERLSLRELFESCAVKTMGYHAMWGSDRISTTNFFFHHPYQYGLKLDKQALLQRLEQLVEPHVLKFDDLLGLDLNKEFGRLQIRTAGTEQQLDGAIIVDATGRARAISKRLNIPSLDQDQIMASSCHLPMIKHPDLTHRVFTESFEKGWGMVSQLDDSTNVMTIFTNKGDSESAELRHFSQWSTTLADTKILKAFLRPECHGKVIGAAANSSRIKQFTGHRWIAIGDSALAFDPLSSHGISNAIYGAFAAYKAIKNAIEGDISEAFQDYEQSLTGIFDQYLLQRRQLYRAENRWPSPFWKLNSK